MNPFTNRSATMYVDRFMVTFWGKASGPCTYALKLETGPETSSPAWETQFDGPGQSFYDAYWHPSNPLGNEAAFIDHVRLLPVNKDQILFYQIQCGEDGCSSLIKIDRFSDITGWPANLLTFRDAGLMTYSVSAGVLTIDGCMGQSGIIHLPGLCSIHSTVSLSFDTDVQSFSIVNRSQASQAFYNYLTTVPQ